MPETGEDTAPSEDDFYTAAAEDGLLDFSDTCLPKPDWLSESTLPPPEQTSEDIPLAQVVANLSSRVPAQLPNSPTHLATAPRPCHYPPSSPTSVMMTPTTMEQVYLKGNQFKDKIEPCKETRRG